MPVSGQNVNSIKYANRSLLLNLLYFGGAQSRKALAQKSGLTAAAITTIINEMIEDCAVIETEKISAEGRLGRNEQLVDLNYKALFVVGINFGSDEFEISLTGLDSKVLSAKKYSLSTAEGDLFFEKLTDIIKELINEASISLRFVVGAGVTIKGIVDTENGVSVNSYGVLNKNTMIKSILKEALGIPVIVENNVRSMLRADITLRHAKPAQSALLIKYGPGVGGALLIGQKSFLGAKCNAVELGHVCVEADGYECICGKRGCLETLVSYDAIIRKAGELFSFDQTPVLYSFCGADKMKLTITNILSAYEKDDIGVENILKDTIKYLGLSISNYASLYDPEVVLLVSEVFYCKKFLDNLQKEILLFSSNSRPKYIIISDCRKLEKYGAASIAINNFLATGAQFLKDIRTTRTEV